MLKNIQNSMRKYWSNSLGKAGTFLFATLSVIGCTKTDDTTGNGSFIPDGGDYKMYQDVISSGFKIKTVRVDSIVSDNLSRLSLGSQVTAREGQINYSIVTQTAPYSTTMMKDRDNNAPFGNSPQIDSAFFSLGVESYFGETDRRYTVSVYELTKTLPFPIDSAYYSNFNIDGYIGSEPLFTIETKLGQQIYTKIPIEYAKKIMSLTRDDYQNFITFREKFKGYYIKTSLTQNGDMISRVLPEKSGIDIFYRNKNEKPDTSIFSLDFRLYETDYWSKQKFYINESFNIISRDYNMKDPALGVKFENDVEADITYVSGMSGLMTRLEIPQSVIDGIKDMVKAKGGSKIMVMNATLVIPNGDVTFSGLNGALNALGGYLRYQPSRNVAIATTDYYSLDYMKDAANALYDYSSAYGTIGIFGGKLNRATGEYRMVISSTIQGLVNDKSTNRVIEIAPSAETFTSAQSPEKESVSVSVLENSSKRPIKLELTYSVVE